MSGKDLCMSLQSQRSAHSSCKAVRAQAAVVGHVLLELLFVEGKLCERHLCVEGIVGSSVCGRESTQY